MDVSRLHPFSVDAQKHRIPPSPLQVLLHHQILSILSATYFSGCRVPYFRHTWLLVCLISPSRPLAETVLPARSSSVTRLVDFDDPVTMRVPNASVLFRGVHASSHRHLMHSKPALYAISLACPLRVYRDKTFVEPREVIEALTGAVVDVYFGISHYYLRDKKFDTFQAEMQQIRIVKPGGSSATSGFKRRNAREGPLDVMKVTSTNGKDKEEGRAEKGRDQIKRNYRWEYIQEIEMSCVLR
jgi:hypothetical protein